MSNLVIHIRRELELIGEEESVIEAFEEIGNIFASVADSGGAAEVLNGTLIELLQFKNLRPLTDNPDEWFAQEIGDLREPLTIWQNIRNPQAMSEDGGKTYFLTGDGSYFGNPDNVMYTSDSYAKLMEDRAMKDVVEVPINGIASEYTLPVYEPLAEDPMDVKPMEVP